MKKLYLCLFILISMILISCGESVNREISVSTETITEVRKDILASDEYSEDMITGGSGSFRIRMKQKCSMNGLNIG